MYSGPLSGAEGLVQVHSEVLAVNPGRENCFLTAYSTLV